MTIWNRKEKSPNEDEGVNPFIKVDWDKPLSSSKEKAEEPAAEAEDGVVEPEVPVVGPSEEPAAEAEDEVVEAKEEVAETYEPAAEAEDGVEETEDAPESPDGEEEGEGIISEPHAEPLSAEPVAETAATPARIDVGGMSGALRGMLSFFTAIPVSTTEGDIESMNSNLWLAPIIGFIFGLFAFVAFSIGDLGNALAGGVLAFATILILNKFLHADGLIDAGDAVAATGGMEKKWRAMKDPAVGAGGIAAAILVMGGTLLFYCDFFAYYLFFIFGIIAEVCSRNTMVAAAAFGIHVEGGMASDSVERTDTGGLIKSTVLTAIICLLVALIGYGLMAADLGDFAPRLGDLAAELIAAIVLAILASIAWGWIVSKYANDKIGGVSGDVLGASVESGRLIALIVVTVVIGLLL